MSLCHVATQLFFLYLYFSDIDGQFLRSQQTYGLRGGRFTWLCDIRGQQNAENVVFMTSGKSGTYFQHICTVNIDVNGTCLYRSEANSNYQCGCINDDSSSLYLNISKVIEYRDEGNWACKRSNDTVNAAYLHVYHGPEKMSLIHRWQLTEGGNATLTCDADCKPQCNLRLYNKTINTSEPSSVNKNQLLSSNGSLSLVNISRHMNGSTIICQAIHPYSGASNTTEMGLNVHYFARHIVFSSDTVIEGQDVNITCSSTDGCNPPCTYNWYEKQTFGSYDGHIVSDNGILNMKMVNRKSSGLYKCAALQFENQRIYSYEYLRLTVCYPPQIKALRYDATNNTINEGSNITLTCLVDSVPDSNISWSRSKERLRSTTDGKLFTTPIASCGHTDMYTCTADNGVGQPDTKTISVYVRCLPRIDQNLTTHSKGVPVIVGDDKTAVLTIYVVAYPLPKFTWYRLYSTEIEKPVTDFSTKQTDTLLSSTLTIDDFTDEDSGYYKVYVENSIGVRSHIFLVSYKPII